MSTIFEGNGTPLGITENQDVAVRALSPQLKASMGVGENQKGRITLTNQPLQLKKEAIIAEKTRRLAENGQEPTASKIMTLFNGEDQAKMKEKTGKNYVEWLSQTLIDIALQPGNEEVKKMMGSLLQVNPIDAR